MALRVASVAATISLAAGTINLAVSDCGDSATLGHVSSISPTSVVQGHETRVTGTGSVDSTVSDGTFHVNVKALGVTLQTCSGNFCGAVQCNLPMGTGSVNFAGVSCPLSAGPTSLGFDVTVSESVPSSLAHLSIEMSASSSSGDKLLCAKIATSPGSLTENVFSKGFVRQPRNAIVPVATITDDMRNGAPAALDWSTLGATSPVKDQGRCGSCWAFSATEGVESAVYQQHGVMPILATQQLVACDPNDGGCNGGDLPTAFEYFESAGGVDSAADYLDTSSRHGVSGKCKASQYSPAVKVTGYKYAVPPCMGGSCSSQDESGLMAALNNFGPLSVCVNAETWNDYYTGVYTASCSGSYNSLDHCVQLVGYDSTGSAPFWKVKNSWTTGWGEGGFIRLPMGNNACGIADEAMFVEAEMISADVSV